MVRRGGAEAAQPRPRCVSSGRLGAGRLLVAALLAAAIVCLPAAFTLSGCGGSQPAVDVGQQIALLKSGSDEQVRAAIDALASSSDPQVFQSVLDAFSASTDVDEQGSEALVLDKLRDPRCIKPLLAWLRANVRASYQYALAETLAQDPKVAWMPIQFKVKPSARVTGASEARTVSAAEACARAIFDAGPKAPQLLRAGLGVRDDSTAVICAYCLGGTQDEQSGPALVRALRRANVRDAARVALAKVFHDDATALHRYLGSPRTAGVYWSLIRIGDDSSVSPLLQALRRFGDKSMAQDYLNSGQPRLEAAAQSWADAHGYYVTPSGSFGQAAPWGSM